MPTLVMPKDDHERERMRWQSKLSDLKQALKQSEECNAELTQCKADLIRKLKESEKMQKNLQETSRKVQEKMKSAAGIEAKK
ncbi:unnamed protein product, partial [Soboliphyme baturini]|uniref:PH domain-containing protein n=1 Tax=Soboliphyme baturini TaxID=241478 RepID=A0A183IPS4_9BILA